MIKVYSESKDVDGTNVLVEAFAPFTQSNSIEPVDMPGLIRKSVECVSLEQGSVVWEMVQNNKSSLIRKAIETFDQAIKALS